MRLEPMELLGDAVFMGGALLLLAAANHVWRYVARRHDAKRAAAPAPPRASMAMTSPIPAAARKT